MNDDSTGVDDIEEIKRLKARYFRMMDTKDWDGLAQVFTDDVEIDMTGEGGGVTRSVGDYMPFLRDNIDHVITVHMTWARARSPSRVTTGLVMTWND